MAADRKVTLTLDFKVEKEQLKEVSNLFNKDFGKNISGSRAGDYLKSIKSAATDAYQAVMPLIKVLSQPLISKEQAKQAATNIDSAFKDIDNRLLSLQGNLSKTFGSVGNAEALKQIRELGKAIDQMTADYEKASQLLSQSRNLGNKTDLKSQLSAATKELNTLSKSQEKLTNDEIKRQSELSQIIEDINQKLEEKNRLSQEAANIQSTYGVNSQAEFSRAIGEKIIEQGELKNGSISITEYNTLRALLEEIRQALINLRKESNISIGSIGTNVKEVTANLEESERRAKTFKSVLSELGVPLLTLHTVANVLRRTMRYSYNYIKNLDAALTEIAIVSGKSRQEVLQLTDTFIELSAKTGMAIDDIAKASTIFYQQGLNDEAVRKLTEYTALFAKISSETVEVASNQITAAINGFNLSVDKAGDVIDKLSVLAAHSAADISELATAMSKAASQANMAGLSFDQYNAYLATMIEVTREAPENIGTSLKTIMSRFQQIKTGDNTEDDTDVNAVETALRSVNVSLRDANGQLRDLGDVLEELGPKWNSLSRNTQAYLGTIIAGTRQQSRFISLMQNWDRAMELTTQSQNSAGAATRMHQSAMEGLDAAINNLYNSWQKLISSIMNGNTFKGLINTATSILKFFGQGNSALRVFTAALTLFNAKTLITNANLAAQGKSFTNIDLTLKNLGGVLSTTKNNLMGLSSKQSEVTRGIEAQNERLREQIRLYRELKDAQNGIFTEGNIATGNKGTGNQANEEEVSTQTGGIKNLFSNAGQLVGKISMITGIVSIITTIFDVILDLAITTSDELKEKGQKLYDETQKEIDKRTDLINVVKTSGETYETLSKKMNKSTDEVKKLSEAADDLAKTIPEALVGFDASGNAIIDMNKAKQAASKAEAERAGYSELQIQNIGTLARSEIRAAAEESIKNNTAWDDVKNTSGKLTMVLAGLSVVIAGVATALSGGAAAPALVAAIGTASGVAAGAALASGLTYVVSASGEAIAVKQEEMNKAIETTNQILTDYGADLLSAISNINQAFIGSGSLSEQRNSTAAFLSNQFMQEKVKDLAFQYASGEIKGKEYEAKFKEIGTQWSIILQKIGTSGLDSIAETVEKLQIGIENRTYQEVASGIRTALKDIGIDESDPFFKSLYNGIVNTIYSGYKDGVGLIIQELEEREAKEKAATKDKNEKEFIKQKYNQAYDILNKSTSQQIGFYSNAGLLDDVDDFLAYIQAQGDATNAALKNSAADAAMSVIAYYEEIKEVAESKMEAITDKTSEEYKKQEAIALNAAKHIEKAWNAMDISSDIPWSTLWSDLEKLTKRVRTAANTYYDLASGKGISIDKWKEFTTLFDNIDYSAMNPEQIKAYGQALDLVANNLTVVNGQIYANGEAIRSIEQLEELAIQASVEQTRQELINKRTELEANQQVLEAEIKTLEWKIAEAKGSKDADKLKIEAESAWADASKGIQEVFVLNQSRTSELMVQAYTGAFAKIATEYNRLVTEMSKGNISEKAIKEFEKSWKAQIGALNFKDYTANLNKANYSLSELEQRLAAARKAAEINSTAISNINLKLATLDAGVWQTLNGNGSGSSSSSNNGIDKYIAKLREIYNILNRIQVLEHRRDVLDKYQDIMVGSGSGAIFSQRLEINKELIEQYKFLTEEQKKFANGYAEFIQSVDGLEGVFDFDQYGQIIVNWEKYNALQDEAIDGEVTLKEKADDVYETYKNMFEDLMDYFDGTIESLEKVIDLEQQVIDTYVSIEKKTADAIKEIYQQMLDDRLKAIDDEKKALEDLRKERERANKEIKDAKEVAGYQSDIQRSMMDTSGASATALIKAQNNLGDKLDSIANDKYSEMISDLEDMLDEQQEALQQEFDEMFDDIAWLFEVIESELMNDVDGISAIWSQTSDWRKETQLEKEAEKQQLETEMSILRSILGDGEQKSIYDVWNELTHYRTELIPAIDNSLKTGVSNIGIEVQATLDSWASKINSTIDSKVGSGGGGGGGYYYPTGSPPETPEPGGRGGGGNQPPADKYNSKLAEVPKVTSKFGVGDTVSSLEAGNSAVSVYKWQNSKMIGGLIWYDPANSMSRKGKNLQNKVVEDIKYYDGQFYYKLKDVGYYVKGLQLTGTTNGTKLVVNQYKKGGFVFGTGPAWLDGTASRPEAVLDALQTEHFIKFTNALDKMYTQPGSSNSSITIDTISFNVDSMSSPEDGEKAFNAFVNKFNEIGNQTGIKFNNFKNINRT